MSITLQQRYEAFLSDCSSFVSSPKAAPKNFEQISEDRVALLQDYSPNVCKRLRYALSRIWNWITSFCCSVPPDQAPRRPPFLSSAERREIQTQFAAVSEARNRPVTPEASLSDSTSSEASSQEDSASASSPTPPQETSSSFYDLPPLLPGAGFHNSGQNCWCNAFLQLVIHIPSLKSVYERVAKGLQDPSSIDEIAHRYAEAFKEVQERWATAFEEKEARKVAAYHEKRARLVHEYRVRLPSLRDKFIQETLPEFDFYDILNKWYPSAAHSENLPPLPEALPVSEPSIDAFCIHFASLLKDTLPFAHEQILLRLESRDEKQLRQSIFSACGLALYHAFAHTRQQYPSVPFNEIATPLANLLPEILIPFIETSIKTHQEAIFGPPPIPATFDRVPPPSPQEAAEKAPIYGNFLEEALKEYETAIEKQTPVPAEVSQNVREALHFLSPLSISTDFNEPADGHEPFSILNRTYQELFHEHPPYSLHYTLKKRYEPETPVAEGFDPPPELGADRCRLQNEVEPDMRLDWESSSLPFEEELDPFFIDEWQTEEPFQWEAPLPPLDTQVRIPLPAKPMIQEYFKKENSSPHEGGATFSLADQDYTTFHCRLVDEAKEFDQYPEDFFIVLNRLAHGFGDTSSTKKSDPIQMPLHLTLPPPAQSEIPSLDSEPEAVGPIYELDAFITHTGDSAQGGHYIADWKDKGEDKTRFRWIHADDTEISFKTQEVVETLCQEGYIFHYRLVV